MADERSPTVFRLIYLSHNAIPLDARPTEHGEIFRVSRRNNVGPGITGALLIYENWFCQVLEGGQDAVIDLISTIEKDPRHEDVEVLDQAFTRSQVFGRWTMAMVSSTGRPDISLIATKDGFTVAASRGLTLGQQRLLHVMRAVTLDAAGRGTAD